jgi:DNA-binding response OmpR family regulator
MDLESTILAVDDDPSIHEAYNAGLKDEGYKIVSAYSGYQALEMAAKMNPDLVLLDIRMPEMDGLEVCRRIRASRILREIPVLLVTALGDRETRLKGFEAGADDLICKPFDLVELRMRVRSICRLNRYRNLLFERIRFSWVVGQSSDGFLILNESDEIRYANAKARLLLNQLPDEIHPIAETFFALVSQQYECEPPEAWANWPQIAPRTAGSAPLFLVQRSARDAGIRLQVDILDLPAGLQATRMIRLREVAPVPNADWLSQP